MTDLVVAVFPHLPGGEYGIREGGFVRTSGAGAVWRVLYASDPHGPDDRRELRLEAVDPHEVPLSVAAMELAWPVAVDPTPAATSRVLHEGAHE